MKKVIVVLIIIGISIFNHIPVLGADWKFFRVDDRGEFFYDIENLLPSSEKTIGVWLKLVYSHKFKQQEGIGDLHHTVGFWEIHCKEKRIRLLLTSHFSEEREGEIPSSPRVFQTPDWEPIPPNTVLDELHRIICEQLNKI